MIFYVTRDDEPFKNMLAYFQSSPFTKFKVEIKEHKKQRSNNQNALYWSWLTIVGKDLGYESEELHEALKAKILGVIERKTIFGNTVNEPRSTTSLNTKEFTEYLNAVQSFAMSLGITLPSPEYYGFNP
jgi:hypothetical protein